MIQEADARNATPSEAVHVVHVDDLRVEKIRRQSRNLLAVRGHHAPGLSGEHLELALAGIDPVKADTVEQAVARYLRVVSGHAAHEITFIVSEDVGAFELGIHADSET